MDEDGIIHYEGRNDSQVKIRGHRVDLNEIEMNLQETEGIKEVIVLCYQHSEHDQMDSKILAFASVESHLQKSRIEEILRSKLPDYMMPEVVIIEEMPVLDNGKIDRQTLIKSYKKSISGNFMSLLFSILLDSFQHNLHSIILESSINYDYTGVSSNDSQKVKILFETIGEVIGHSTSAIISLSSNFYELGGNSLNSIYTIAKLRDRGYSIEITDFILAKNLHEIVSVMKEINPKHRQNIKPSENTENFTVEPLQMKHQNEAIQ